MTDGSDAGVDFTPQRIAPEDMTDMQRTMYETVKFEIDHDYWDVPMRFGYALEMQNDSLAFAELPVPEAKMKAFRPDQLLQSIAFDMQRFQIKPPANISDRVEGARKIIGFCFSTEGWAVSIDRQKLDETMQAIHDHTLHEHPERREVKMFHVSLTDGTYNALIWERGDSEPYVLTNDSPGMAPYGEIIDALSRMSALLED